MHLCLLYATGTIPTNHPCLATFYGSARFGGWHHFFKLAFPPLTLTSLVGPSIVWLQWRMVMTTTFLDGRQSSNRVNSYFTRSVFTSKSNNFLRKRRVLGRTPTKPVTTDQQTLVLYCTIIIRG
jgi:hypothetical protein